MYISLSCVVDAALDARATLMVYEKVQIQAETERKEKEEKEKEEKDKAEKEKVEKERREAMKNNRNNNRPYCNNFHGPQLKLESEGDDSADTKQSPLLMVCVVVRIALCTSV